MPRFGTRSNIQLDTCHPEIQRILNEAIKYFDFSVICGHRDRAGQELAFKTKKTQLDWPNSKHNKLPSMAVDIAPWPISWENVSSFKFLAGHILTVSYMMHSEGRITHLMRWGGDWDNDKDMNDQKFIDLPHFELIEKK